MLMSTKVFIGVFCGFALAAQLSAQEVIIVREKAPAIPKAEAVAPKQVAAEFHVEKAIPVRPVSQPAVESKTTASRSEPIVQIKPPAPKVATQSPSVEVRTTPAAPVAPGLPPPPQLGKVNFQTSPVSASVAAAKPAAAKPQPNVAPGKPAIATVASSAPSKKSREPDSVLAQPLNIRGTTAFTKLANGFDFPIGKPDAQGYYKARGFQGRSHVGEDWDGVGGGDTDLGDPVYCAGDGVVVFARDCHQGWGNVAIVRHAYREGGTIRNIDSLYAHCQKLLVRRGDTVSRGQQIATIGNAHGLYDAHLHFEIRKNIAIGMSRDKFAKDFSNYCDPTQFITSHRRLENSRGNYRIAMNTFTYDEKIRWDKLRNYSRARTGGGSSQSARNLKKALAAQNVGARAN